MIAVISDIHSNLEALEAVLADARRHQAEAIYCLGDVVGYRPDPVACVDLAKEWPLVLLGNHEHWLLNDPRTLETGNLSLLRSLIWTEQQLEQGDYLNCFRQWPRSHREGQFQFVHGTVHKPLYEYVFPEDIYYPAKMERIFALLEGCCFQGHAHVPGIFTDEPLDFRDPASFDYFYKLDGKKTLINVGSVGQPRDGDWRACYVLWHGNNLQFRRVEYDIDKTVRKIYANPELENFLGDRLRDGR